MGNDIYAGIPEYVEDEENRTDGATEAPSFGTTDVLAAADNLPANGANAPQDVNKPLTADDVIKRQSEKNIQAISNDKSFVEMSRRVDAQDVKAKVEAKAISTISQQIDNEYEKYRLKKRKELLDYRTKLEKGLIKKQVEAEVQVKIMEIAQKRYGYLYTTEVQDTLDDDGNSVKRKVYKDFCASNSINRAKEIANWFKNLSDGTKKTVGSILKTVFWILVVVGIGCGIVYGVRYLLASGILQIK